MPHPASQRAKFMNHCLPKCCKSLYGVKCNNPRYLRIDATLSTSNPGAAEKFYTADYVLVPADLLILRANITKLSELLENISDINTLFHSKTGKLMQGEGCSKLFDEEVISRLDMMKLKKS